MKLLRTVVPLICLALVGVFVPTTAHAATNQQGTYFPVAPARLLDTGNTNKLGATSLNLTVAGKGGVPTTGASAVVVNLTVAGGSAGSYLTAWPTGQTRPVVSSINFTAGETRANIATVPVGSGGQISIFNHAGAVRVVVDVVGYYSSTGTTSTAGDEYTSQPPERLADTRGSAEGQLAARDSLIIYTDFGTDGNQSQYVHALALNITAVNAQGSGYLTAWDGGSTLPSTSTLNYTKGKTISNMAVVSSSLCTDPTECDTTPNPPSRFGVYNGSSQPVDVIVDLVGIYYIDGTLGLRFQPLATPKRISDSRTSLNGTTMSSGQTQTLTAPAAVVGADTSSLVTNLTAVRPTASPFLTLWSSGTRPATSNINAAAGSTVANGAVVDLSGSNTFQIYNSAGNTDFLIDVTGRFDVAGAAVAQQRTQRSADFSVSGSHTRRLAAGAR